MKDDKRKKKRMSDDDWKIYILKWMDIWDQVFILIIILVICIFLGIIHFIIKLV